MNRSQSRRFVKKTIPLFREFASKQEILETKKLEELYKIEKRRSTELLLLLNIARLVECNPDELNALNEFLKEVCAMSPWLVGEVYLLNPQDDQLVSVQIWQGEKHTQVNFQDFLERTILIHKGGLLRQVLELRQGGWLEELSDDPRFKGLENCLFHSSFAVPIFKFGKIIAVAEFFSLDHAPKNKRLLEVIQAASNQLSHFLELRETQKQMKENHEQLQQALQKIKEAQGQLIQSEKMASIGVLAAGMAHEINNPLAYILSNMHVLKEYANDLKAVTGFCAELTKTHQKEKIVQLLSTLRSSLQKIDWDYIVEDFPKIIQQSFEGLNRVKEIVKNLKDFAHVDNTEIKLFNVNDCIRSALKMVWHELKYKCEVVENYGEIPSIACMPQRLNQVFLNLLVNASQAIEGRGTIYLSSRLDKDQIVIEVKDTGKGIEVEHLNEIFDPFFTTKPVGTGTGLGLFLVHDIISAHGGKVSAASELNKGTAFHIALPVKGISKKDAA